MYIYEFLSNYWTLEVIIYDTAIAQKIWDTEVDLLLSGIFNYVCFRMNINR